MNWITEVGRTFPRGEDTPLPRPVKEFFLCPHEKILYAPIAKCACTSLKTMMVNLSNIEHKETVFEYGVHAVTNAFNTGAQAKDHPIETVRSALSGDDYYRFTVIREPVSRLISAYTEKFWRNRLHSDNKTCTQDVIRKVRHEANPDFEKGVSFREFVDYIVNAEPTTLDPHWAPQSQFIVGVNRFDDIFTTAQLDSLQEKISTHTGRKISLEKLNTSVAPLQSDDGYPIGRYVDLSPMDLDALEIAPIASDFMLPEILERLKGLYMEDIQLFERAQQGLQNFEPPSLSLEGVTASAKYRDTAEDIAPGLQLYSKGFFGIDSQGYGQIPIVISNGSLQPLNLGALQSIHLHYTLCDSTGKPLSESRRQPIYLNVLAAAASHMELLEIEVPEQSRSNVAIVQVSLQFDDDFKVADHNPIHVTSAKLLQSK